MLRKLILALVLLALLAGGAILYLRRQLSAVSPAPPELARVADPSSQRSLPGAGEVVGYTGRYGSHVWLGIPYAAPPVGERRWRAPAPPERWSGVREALAFGAHCPQIASVFGGVSDVPSGTLSGSEDCLFLNVYAPRMDAAAAAQARLPVMMWIHGGGNTIGLSDFFDGGRLAQDQNLVVVTINYRLGPLGWFRHASLREGATPAEQSGNFTTLDLIRALEWLRENVAGFGGDPGNITIFGESAGGHNVFTLLLSPLANGLFQRAIAQSGGTGTIQPAEAENFADDAEPGQPSSSNQVLLRLLVADGKASDPAAARQALAAMSPSEIAGFLRSRTPEQLIAGYEREFAEGMFEMPQVFADGVVLPAGDPLSLLARPDGWNRVPVMAGTNLDEHKVFMFMSPLYVRRWLGVMPQVREPDFFEAMAEKRSALWKATGADGPAAAIWKTQPNVFVYRFDWDEEPSLLGIDAARYVGAAHGFEIPFVFGHWDLGGDGKRDLRPVEPGRARGALRGDDVVLGQLRAQRRSRARRPRRAAGLERVGRAAPGPQVHDSRHRGGRRPSHGLGPGHGGERAGVGRGRPAPCQPARPLPGLPRAGGLGRRLRTQGLPDRGQARLRRVSLRQLPLELSERQRPATAAATQRQAAAGVGESMNRRRRSRLRSRPRARGASSRRMRRARSLAPMLESRPASW